MRVFGRKGFYIKKTDVVEQLFRTTTIVFDKTGTITLNRKVDIKFIGQELSESELKMVRGMVRHSSHPLSNSLYDFIQVNIETEPETYEEIPGMGITGLINSKRLNIGSEHFVTGKSVQKTYTESRVYMSIKGEQKGYFSFSNTYRPGLKEVIEKLSQNYELHLISGDNDADIKFIGQELSESELKMVRGMVRHSSHPLSNSLYDFIQVNLETEPETYEEIPGMGITGLMNSKRLNIGSEHFVTGKSVQKTYTESRVYISIKGEQKGYFSFSNTYRPGLKEVIEKLANYELHLISGDNDAEKENLSELFGSKAKLLFNQSPTDKKAYIQSLKSEGKIVLMVGDGLNDAGALNESHAGITIADDVFSFSPACDAILESARFSQLEQFLTFSKTSFKVIWWSFAISIIYNVIGLSFAVTAQLSPLIAAILMPLSSITVVAFATFTINGLSRNKLFQEKIDF